MDFWRGGAYGRSMGGIWGRLSNGRYRGKYTFSNDSAACLVTGQDAGTTNISMSNTGDGDRRGSGLSIRCVAE